MSSLTVRKLDEELVRLLRQRAARHGRSAEAEHREILRVALSGERKQGSWQERAARLREIIGDAPQTPSEVLQRESRDER
jgi:plasmid stability protein